MKNVIFIYAGALLGPLGMLAAEAKVDFAKDVLPVFQQNCVGCHGPEKQKGKLRLDAREAVLKTGGDTPLITPGDAAKSEIYRRVTLPKEDDDFMPSGGEPLSPAQLDLIRNWINQGAVWPAEAIAQPTAPAKPVAPAALPADYQPGPNEPQALALLAKSGVEARPLALNIPWREANFRLQSTNITDASLAPLRDLGSLVELNLATTKITDAGLVNLESLTHLQRLHLELTPITDAGLEHLKPLKQLTYLNLYGTQVTDAGLQHLKGLTRLKNLYLWQTKVTAAGIADLKTALPELQVILGWEPPVVVKTAEAKTEATGKK